MNQEHVLARLLKQMIANASVTCTRNYSMEYSGGRNHLGFLSINADFPVISGLKK